MEKYEKKLNLNESSKGGWLGTKEHYDLMLNFEKLYKGHRLDKEDKKLWSKSIIYQDGLVNKLFLAYRYGYTLGKSGHL